MCIILHILYKIAPGSDLRSNIKELCKYSFQEVRILKQLTERTLIISLVIFPFILYYREFGDQNQHSPEQNHPAQYQVGCDDPHGFVLEVLIIGPGLLHGSNLCFVEFYTRENKQGPDEYTD